MAILPELETPRLSLRRLVFDDAPFLVGLLNQPSFIRNIGDRGVRNADDAHRYLREGPMAMYDRYGFGLWLVSRRDDGAPIGMCGLLKRDILPDADIGYAFVPEVWGQGYAFEAAQATLEHGVRKFGLKRLIGVVSDHNAASIRVLEKLGLRFERLFAMRADEPEVLLYSIELASPR
ncbi:MAG TPA: GNAT family N-acetyltransferase [Steroidobacteraceae bacterium]|nr:GNAT family N-acetyltransferase [Steroidobacteraceae bacterium]